MTNLKNKFRIILVLPFIFFFAACQEKERFGEGAKLDPSLINQIKIGQTTQAEVESLLGKPSFERKSNGSTQLFYTISQSYKSHDAVELAHPALVGLAGSLAAMALFSNDEMQGGQVIIVIDKSGFVQDIKKFGYEGHNTGLLVKDNYRHPDITNVDQITPGITTKEQVYTLLATPPSMSFAQTSDNTQYELWFIENGQLMQIAVIFRQDGIVDELKKCFKEAPMFPKSVSEDKLDRIQAMQSTREDVQSFLGRPATISRNTLGRFYTYSFKLGKNYGELYIQYDNKGVVSYLNRKVRPPFFN